MHLLRFAALLLAIIIPASRISAQSDDLENLSQASPVSPSGSNLLRTNPLISALPAEQAFPFDVFVELPDHLVASWDIQEGYYLYRKSLRIEAVTNSDYLGEPLIPQGEMINDSFFGDVEVFYDRLLVRIPLNRLPADSLELMIEFQGCAEIGYCYPMQFRQVNLDFSL